MSDFTTYNSLIEQKIANTSEVFYTTQVKRQAVNDTIKQIIQEYDLPEMMKRGTLTIASGLATKPTDYYRMVKLWENDSNNVQLNEYVYLEADVFDKQGASGAYWWTEDYDTVTSLKKLYIKPTTKTSLLIRYIKNATTLNDDSTDSGLSANWDEVVADGSVARLLRSSGRYEEANQYEMLFRKHLGDVYALVKNPGGIKQNDRLKSKYERLSQLGQSTISANLIN